MFKNKVLVKIQTTDTEQLAKDFAVYNVINSARHVSLEQGLGVAE
jgi:hypothetical protein